MNSPHVLLKKAHEYHEKGDLDKAEKLYLDLLNRHMQDPNLLFLLGTLYLQQGNNGLAATLLHSATLHNPKFPEALNNLGSCLKAENFDDSALEAYNRALELNKTDPDIWNNLSTVYVNAGEPEKCLKYAQKAIDLNPEHWNAQWNKALALLEMEHWKLGFESYDYGFKSNDRIHRNYSRPGNEVPDWDGTPNKTVIVYGEQGVGDEIMFASCIPDLIKVSKKVIIDCHPRLVRTFARSFNVECHGTRKENEIRWLREPVDYAISMGSLPKFFRKKTSDFPKHNGYIKADPLRVEYWRDQWKDKFTVLLAWAGGKKKTRGDLRSIPLGKFGPILNQDARFISIQYTDGAYLEAQKHGLEHHQWAIDDLEEMHSMIEAADLVITVNQSAVHSAGALGTDCFCLTPSKPAWRYGTKHRRMVWYPSVEQFRQKEDYNWDPVIKEVADRLKDKISKSRK